MARGINSLALLCRSRLAARNVDFAAGRLIWYDVRPWREIDLRRYAMTEHELNEMTLAARP